jgi:hypothetical protein
LHATSIFNTIEGIDLNFIHLLMTIIRGHSPNSIILTLIFTAFWTYGPLWIFKIFGLSFTFCATVIFITTCTDNIIMVFTWKFVFFNLHFIHHFDSHYIWLCEHKILLDQYPKLFLHVNSYFIQVIVLLSQIDHSSFSGFSIATNK